MVSGSAFAEGAALEESVSQSVSLQRQDSKGSTLYTPERVLVMILKVSSEVLAPILGR